MGINLIFKIAAVGILITILSQVLKHSGREEHAFLISLACSDQFLSGPIFYLFLHILKHLNNLNVGAAVAWTFQGADGCCNGRIGICQGGCDNMGGKGGIISAAMLHMQNKCNV